MSRITLGNGTDLHGKAPLWNPSGDWEIECSVVFPTTDPVAGFINYLDGNGTGNRGGFYTDQVTGNLRSYSGTLFLDGVEIAQNSVPYPQDGEVHTIKITGVNGIKVHTLLARETIVNHVDGGGIFNLQLTDVGAPANNISYPLDDPFPAENPTAGLKSHDVFLSDAAPVEEVIAGTLSGLWTDDGDGVYSTTNDDTGNSLKFFVSDSSSVYRVTLTADFTLGSRLKLDGSGSLEIEGSGTHTFYVHPDTLGLTAIQFARQGGAVSVALSDITIERMPNAGMWYNRTAGDVIALTQNSEDNEAEGIIDQIVSDTLSDMTDSITG